MYAHPSPGHGCTTEDQDPGNPRPMGPPHEHSSAGEAVGYRVATLSRPLQGKAASHGPFASASGSLRSLVVVVRPLKASGFPAGLFEPWAGGGRVGACHRITPPSRSSSLVVDRLFHFLHMAMS